MCEKREGIQVCARHDDLRVSTCECTHNRGDRGDSTHTKKATAAQTRLTPKRLARKRFLVATVHQQLATL